MRRSALAAAALAAGLGVAGPLIAPHPASATTVTVVNIDGPGEGFNDTTPVAPVGGNPGTTLGAQRLNAFTAAANVWAGTLNSSVEIKVDAKMDPQFCNSGGAVLGSAGPQSYFKNFTGALRADTYYPQALANTLAGVDVDPGTNDIKATFNSAIGTTCSAPFNWYYGLDGNATPSDVDFFTVVLHELGHGFGFSPTVDPFTGKKFFGAENTDDIYIVFLKDHSTGKQWPDMTDAERAASTINTGNLYWTGPAVVAASGFLTSGRDAGTGQVQMYAPSPVQPGSSIAHWDTALFPNQLQEPFYTGPIHQLDLGAKLMLDVGWTLSSCGDGVVNAGEGCDDGNTNNGDGCSATCQVEPCHTCSGAPSVCTPLADGTSCNDGLFCNGADHCSMGNCTVHAGNPCPGPDGDGNCSESCDEATESCTAPDPDGSPCNDGDSCTTPDTCTGGVCAGTPACVNHFLCYKVKTTNTFTFMPVTGATLTDQLDTGFVFDAVKPKRLCTPADENGSGIPDPATHVKGYQIKAEATTPKHVSQANLTVRNQFGDIHLDTVKPDFLLVPTAKNLTTDPPPPGANQVDNYKCYKVKVTPGMPKFPKGTTAMVSDQFTSPAKSLDVLKPTHLCTPVDLNGSGIEHPSIHQLCYKAKTSKGGPKHLPQLGLHVNNTFSGLERLDTKKEELLCVPSLKFLPGP